MKNKVAIITGASSGIGKALAYEFGRKGYQLVITGTNDKRISEVSKTLDEMNVIYKSLIHDVSKQSENKKMIDLAIETFGRIDVLICNAGISVRSLFENVDLDIFKKLFDINFFGSIYGTKFALPYLIKSKGSIIATRKVERKTVSRWGILGFKNKAKNSFLINDVIEKPKLSEAPSNYAIIGRYILPMKILSVLKNQPKGKGGEIHITDAIKTLVKKNEKFYGNIFKGKYIDCGTLDGFVNSGLTISKYL